jgi:hypothetical protein
MSVSNILTSLNNQVQSTLGQNWRELDYVYNLENNNFKNASLGFAVGVKTGNQVTGTNKSATVDQVFFVSLTECFVNRYDDAKERQAISNLYDQIDAVTKDIFQKKLNNDKILVVQSFDYEEPNNPDESTVALTVNFIIKYRNNTF